MKKALVLGILVLMLAVPMAGATNIMKITNKINPGMVIIGVKDTSIALNSTLVLETLPSLSPAVFIMTGTNNSPQFVNAVQQFIYDYKKKYLDKKVLQYFFYYKTNTTVYKPHLYKDVDFVVVSPMSISELRNYTKMLAGRKILVVENYIIATARFKNGTGENITEAIPINDLIELYKQGKIAGVLFPFYQVERDGSRALLNKMKDDVETLTLEGVPVSGGIVQPYVNFFTGSIDVPRTVGSIIMSNEIFKGTIYLSWDNMPVLLLAYLDPWKFQNNGHHTTINWNKAGVYLGMVPAVIILAIFVVAIARRGKKKKKDKRTEKEEKKDKNEDSGKKGASEPPTYGFLTRVGATSFRASP